ncbi:MAG: ABC transporter substrate-binding protein, partial [Anaerolineaceae bacterium]|nr:ABC transporter substrate-binding protein [Anaerolineaceae bacterium]
MPYRRRLKWLLPLLLAGLLAACQPAAQEPAPPPPATDVPALPTPTVTPAPPKTLVVCLRQEPATLYAYGGSSQSMWSVLEAVYDGPFDTRQHGVQPVILESLPDFENGGASFALQDVLAGDLVVDVDGNLAVLETGIRVHPAGCSAQDCIIEWDGSTPLQMERLELTFRLLPDLTWSDGAPLTAADSVYSFELSNDPATPVSREVTARTASYTALDELTVKWAGLPGYFPQRYQTLFWLPLPEHIWSGMTAAELLASDLSAERPLGWGPYVIDEWVRGDHIQLRKNPAYFRADEGLPAFDILVYRFLGEYTDSNLTALLTEECDVIDQAPMVDDDLDVVLRLGQNNELQSWIAPSAEWEHLDFGIVPASYDDGYNAFVGDRPDFFGDVRTRQAFTMCMDRPLMVSRWLWNQSPIPVGYVAPSHPLALTDQSPLDYDPIAGAQLLDQVGWRDYDGDPATPRVAAGVAGVPDGTPLSVNYATTQA